MLCQCMEIIFPRMKMICPCMKTHRNESIAPNISWDNFSKKFFEGGGQNCHIHAWINQVSLTDLLD